MTPIHIYRLGNWLYRSRIPVLPKMLTILNRLIFSAYLPSSATIGKNFKVGYMGLGIVIHTRAKIGDNCLVAQNVTIGRNFGDKQVPQIGNDVYIGAGSAVFGEITIGDNVIIGANSVVNKSVPANSVVVGNPGKVIRTTPVPYHQLDQKAT